ncbi:MAG: hypothetical protein ACTSVI_14135 [Promethearchaeota archaeon]
MLKFLFKSRTFHILNVTSVIFIVGFYYFEIVIHWDDTKVPGNLSLFFRDFIWIFYWRWNLDYLIIPAFVIIVLIECFLIRKALNKGARKRVISTWVVPVVTFAFSFLYMVAIDIAVTWFADTGLDGNWESDQELFLGFTAQGLYHQFFFWFIPAVIIGAICMQVFIQTNQYEQTLKAFLVSYSMYCLNLGFLDPVVCHVIGLTALGNENGWYWASFGDWAMGGADKIWAEGWILHYIIFAFLSLMGVWLISRIKKEISRLQDNELDIPSGGHRFNFAVIFSIVMTIIFLAWYVSILPYLIPVYFL